jgi:GT2 family glycosyltransferase
MSKTLIGISSFGGLRFLELCIREIQKTTSSPFDFRVIVGKPGDVEMQEFLSERKISFTPDRINRGFASNVNDLYDAAFVYGDYDNLIIVGNDVVVMPGAVDAMIATADSTDYEMVCGSEFNSQFLVNVYPEARQYFRGEDLLFDDFSTRPWDLHTERRSGIQPCARKDIRNFTLFKRSSFEKAGYDDVVFWPNAYFADNAYGLRCDKLNVTCCGLLEAAFFHFTSRTVRQSVQREHHAYFQRNRDMYVHQWGGEPGNERYDLPYHGEGFGLSPSIWLRPDLRIGSRDQEDAIIEYWSRK